MGRSTLNSLWIDKISRITITDLNNKGTSGEITIPVLKLYHKAIVIKPEWYWYHSVNQWKRADVPEVTPYSCGPLSKNPNTYSGKIMCLQ